MTSRAVASSLRSARRPEGDIWQQIAIESLDEAHRSQGSRSAALLERARQRASRSRPWLQEPRPQPESTQPLPIREGARAALAVSRPTRKVWSMGYSPPEPVRFPSLEARLERKAEAKRLEEERKLLEEQEERRAEARLQSTRPSSVREGARAALAVSRPARKVLTRGCSPPEPVSFLPLEARLAKRAEARRLEQERREERRRRRGIRMPLGERVAFKLDLKKSALKNPKGKAPVKTVGWADEVRGWAPSATLIKNGTTHEDEKGQERQSRRFRESRWEPDTDGEASRRLFRRCHDKGDLAKLKLQDSSRYSSINGALVGWDDQQNYTTWNSMQSHAPCYDDHYRLRLGPQDIVARFLTIEEACNGNQSLAVEYIDAYKRAMIAGLTPMPVDEWLAFRES